MTQTMGIIKRGSFVLNLLDFKRKNAFRIYTCLFLGVVMFQRYYVLDSILDCGEVYEPEFFQQNYIRVLFLLMPFLYFSFFYQRHHFLESLKENLPFLFIGLATVSLHKYQPLYLALFVITGMMIKRLRLTALVAGLTFCYLFLPDVLGTYSCDKATSLKANMHTFQVALETYAFENGGKYPESSLELSKLAKQGHYWKDFVNPYQGMSGYNKSYRNVSQSELIAIHTKNASSIKTSFWYKLDLLGVRLWEDTRYYHLGGQVLYYPITDKKYLIYGARNRDTHLMYDRHQAFVLSNS
jgi:hypothetical protein